MADEFLVDQLKSGGVDAWNNLREKSGDEIAIDLSGADLHYANLHDANLHGADLSDANLNGADLRGRLKRG